MTKFEKKWSPCFGEGHLANQNARFQSHDSKQQEDGSHFCSVMQHNADKHILLQVCVCSQGWGNTYAWSQAPSWGL